VGKGRRDQKVSSAGWLWSRRLIGTLNVLCCIKYPQNAILRWSYTQSFGNPVSDLSQIDQKSRHQIIGTHTIQQT